MPHTLADACPTTRSQHRGDLGRHRTRAPGHVPPAVTQHRAVVRNHGIVPTQIAKSLADGMGFTTVEFHYQAP